MDRNIIIDRITEVFRSVFDDESIILIDSTTADDIEDWDSLSHILLINEIEDAFDCKFNMEDIISMKNVSDMADMIERKFNK